MATPSEALSPALLHSAAAAPSLNPHPATVNGTSMVTRTGPTRGRRAQVDVSTPTLRAARTKTAR
jgi:hypothetical protein